MMNIYYLNSRNDKIDLLSDKIAIQDIESLFGVTWEYTSRDNSFGGKVKRIYKGIQEKTMTLSVFADTEAEFSQICSNLHNVFDYDTANKSPGRLYVNGYYITCYMISSGYKEFEDMMYCTDIEYSLVAEFPSWVLENSETFEDSDNKNACVAEYAYADSAEVGTRLIDVSECDTKINNTGYKEANIIIKVYGYALDPEIVIGGNKYNVSVTVPNGSTLEINTLKRKCLLIDSDGNAENVFAKRNVDYDIYAKIPTGHSGLYWNGLFTCDVVLLDERGEPKWI